MPAWVNAISDNCADSAPKRTKQDRRCSHSHEWRNLFQSGAQVQIKNYGKFLWLKVATVTSQAFKSGEGPPEKSGAHAVSSSATCVTPPGPWTTSGPLSHGCSQQGLPRQSFWGHSGAGQVTEPGHFVEQLRTLSQSVTPWTPGKNPIFAAGTWDRIL